MALTITLWASAFEKLYAKQDAERTPEEMWIGAMAHCSKIGESIRKLDYDELMFFAAKAFCWMLSFSVKCNRTPDPFFRCDNTFSDMVYLKFPESCGHCTHNVCDCRPIEIDAKKDKAAKYSTLLEKWQKARRTTDIEYTIQDWLGTFTQIYSGRIHLQTMETLGFHFLEEAGEEAMAVRKLVQLRGAVNATIAGIDDKAVSELTNIPAIVSTYIKLGQGKPDGKPPFKLNSKEKVDILSRIVDAKMDFIIELADTFSFFCSILIKLGEVRVSKRKRFPADLEKRLVHIYGDPEAGLKCPECKKGACECIFFSTPPRSRALTK